MKFFTETFYDTQAGVLEFHFERVGYPTTTAYKVAVISGPGTTFNFTMKEYGDKWKITDAFLPGWIMNFEEELSDSICAHHRKTAAF